MSGKITSVKPTRLSVLTGIRAEWRVVVTAQTIGLGTAPDLQKLIAKTQESVKLEIPHNLRFNRMKKHDGSIITFSGSLPPIIRGTKEMFALHANRSETMHNYALPDFRHWGRRLFSASLFLVLSTSTAFAARLLPPTNLSIGTGGSTPVTGTGGGTTVNSSAIPMSLNDPMFANTVNSGELTLQSGQSASNLNINDQSGNPAITCNGSCNLDHIRITTREGPRCVSGSINLSYMFIDTTGQGADHADGLQCYNPNGTGTVTVKNTTFRGYPDKTHTGYWSADGWKGNHVFENVLFWGANFGLRIPYDGGSSVSLKNVYFVQGSFGIAPFQFDAVNGKVIPIQQWENVRWVTIQNGQMVIGDLIPKPY